LNRRGSGAVCSQGRVLLSVALLVAVGAAVLGFGSGAGPARVVAGNMSTHSLFSHGPATPAQRPQVRVAYSHLPLIFERNEGQSSPTVRFLARGSGYGLFLTGQEAVLALQSSVPSLRSGQAKYGRQVSGKQGSVLRMSLANANPSAFVDGADLLPGKSNYFIGNDPAKWHRNVPQFARVRYREVYPGIDLTYYGNQGRLEYDFEVAPGADPKQVTLRFQGTGQPKLDGHGNLVLALGGGDVWFEAPRVYQKIEDEQRPVAGRFVLRGEYQVGFELGAYDRSRALVIDPVLAYSTFFGGSGEEGCSIITGSGVGSSGCPAIAVDSAFNMYVAGTTTSTDFFPCCATVDGPSDIFIAKFNSNGSLLLFATYLGGDGTDISAGVAVDSGFNPVVTGTTDSTDFPTNGAVTAFQATPVSVGTHAFVTKLDSTGATLAYSTYLSGNGTDTASAVAIDPRNKIYVTGTTTSTDNATGFPATAGAFQTASKANSQFFMSKIDPVLPGFASLAYSTYFGGGNPAGGATLGGGIAVDTVLNGDNAYNVYITGGTNFLNTRNDPTNDFPTTNGFQSCLDGPGNPDPCDTSATATDAFVAKFNPAAPAPGAQLLYSTYIGGTGDEIGYGIAVDSTPNTYVAGSTSSTDIILPTGTTPFQSVLAGGSDAFVAKIGSPVTGSTIFPLNYFSYLGGSADDAGLAIAVDTNQGARVTGWTGSADFPNQNNPIPGGPFGNTDAFVARIDTTAISATALGHFSTYLGGGGNDFGTSIAIDSQGNSYVAGETASGDFLTVAPFQGTLGGGSGTDAFVSKLTPSVVLAMTATACTTSPCVVGVGNPVSYAFTITNNGDLASGVAFTDFLPTNATFVSATSSTGTNVCGGANGGTVACNIGTLNSSATATVTVVLTPTLGPTLSNSAQVTAIGGSTQTASASATVNDFQIGQPAPATVTVAAGLAASYNITVTPTGVIPNSVSLSCSSGVPTAATCSFTTNPIPDFKSGSAATSTLNIGTTARPAPAAALWPTSGPLYATWLPVSGLALLGAGIGGKRSRRRRLLTSLLLGGFFAFVLFQAGCGSSSKSTTTTGGTPAGDYTITVTAASGSATRTTTLELVVQ
jgi:uncharacterized repeat protein (TIGR01451 family)